MKWQSLPCLSYLGAIYAFFYVPLIILVLYSFNDAQYSLVWHGISLKWYNELFSDTALWTAALHSLILGLSSSTAAVAIALLAVTCFYFYEFMGRSFQYGLIFMLIISPDIVMGITLLLLFNFINLPLGFISLFLAHTTLCLPFAIATIYSRIVSINPNLVEAAKDLGANDARIFTHIMIPLLQPAIIAAWLLSFTLSLDDLIVSYFVSGPEFEILPLRIYSMTRLGVTPTINALCTVTFAISLSLVILSQRVLKHAQD